jgi:vitamin-K-epoxide reductase (warfarin-sensitive)
MPAAVNAPPHVPQTAPEGARAHLMKMTAIALLAVAGVAVSSVSLYEHFATSKTSFCDFSESFNCDIVNRSAYSTVLGMPVALIGIIGYLLITALATIYRNKAETPVLLLIASAGGLGFALYLTYIEKFVLGVWCILCLASLGLICCEVILSTAAILRRPRRSNAQA